MTGRNGGKQHIPKEYDEVLYVYDRVCPKGTKSNQMRRTYGPVNSTTHNANPNRVYGAAFAESQRRRAEAYKKASAYQK